MVKINENGGVYSQGKTFPYEKKLQVALAYDQIVSDGKPVSARKLSEKAKVGKDFARKIMDEIELYGEVTPPMVASEKDLPRGAGAKSLSFIDECVLLQVYYSNPKTLLRQYQSILFHQTGSAVSKTVLSDWFCSRFPVKMSFRKTNKVPLDKFKLKNVLRIHEYHLTVNFLLQTPWKLKFGDEKPLKGCDLFNGAARKDPFTGIVPPTIVNSDFRNTYNVIGYCGIDISVPAVDYYIVGEDQTTTAFVFMESVKCSI
mgnify:CR=1 FL=1